MARSYFIAMAIAGAFAGLAGAIDVTGWEYQVGPADLQASQIGFIGLAAALLGRNTAVGVGFASLLFGALITGTSSRQLDPTIFRPDLAENLTIDHPGARRPLRRPQPRRPSGRGFAGGGAREPLGALHAAVGIVGIALGALAFWLALPPLAARTAVLPIAIGLLAIGAGIWAASRGARRPGRGARSRPACSGSCSASSRPGRRPRTSTRSSSGARSGLRRCGTRRRSPSPRSAASTASAAA